MWCDIQAQLDTYIAIINAHSNTLEKLTDEQESRQREIGQAVAGLAKARAIRSKTLRHIALGVKLPYTFDLCERYMRDNGIPIPQEPAR